MEASHAEGYPRKRSCGRAPLTDEELEVANLLYELPDRILEIKRRRTAYVLPRLFVWGARKPRTMPHDEKNHHPPGRQRSPPSRLQQPPLVVVEEKKPEICPAVATTSSPSTPLSFPGSGGEDSNNNDAAVAVRPKVPAFKSSKERNEWMEEQYRVIASLTQSNATLQQDIKKYTALLPRLTSESFQLRIRESTMPPAEAPAVPPESENSVFSSQCGGAQCALPPADTELKPVTNLPDLNEPAAETTEEPSSAPAVPSAAAELLQQKDKGTAYAEARRRAKRRRELQRARNSPSGRRASDPSISNMQRPI